MLASAAPRNVRRNRRIRSVRGGCAGAATGGGALMIGSRSALMSASLLVDAGMIPLSSGTSMPAQAADSQSQHLNINCEYSPLCPDVANPAEVFGTDEYVGHDEPSLLFYSNTPGSGNQMRYDLRLPRDPTPARPTAPGKAYNFELNGAFWFGMALCDTQSYPEQVSTCTPDSDSNIVDPTVSPNHPGTAFMELQFYPPGWVPWPTWAVAIGADTCNPTRWCAAMNVFSLLEDPVNGTLQNPTCASRVGIETFQFAFVTRNGVAQAPANPIDSTLATFTPNPGRDLFMSAGDQLQVSMHDTANGLQAQIDDQTTGQSGSMTAGPTNGFAQIQYEVQGCTEANTGFDGVPYTPVWPDGNTALHSTPIQFTSALTGSGYDQPYDRAAFEADLPRIEFSTCNRTTGAGCTLIPTTDDNQPAAFYPFFTNATVGGACNWQFGNSIPGDTREFGQNAQYGSLLPLDYLAFGGGGATIVRYNDFRKIISNPC